MCIHTYIPIGSTGLLHRSIVYSVVEFEATGSAEIGWPAAVAAGKMRGKKAAANRLGGRRGRCRRLALDSSKRRAQHHRCLHRGCWVVGHVSAISAAAAPAAAVVVVVVVVVGLAVAVAAK